ncbi:MAG: hypothetical protein F4X60_10045 [Gemmatimonadetes bacterium]|nr:hypothetical protein [Gemmatimonadota bacterium]MYB98882.1 hypothetical protein [Gemmatimonadota bacterium]
MGNAIRWSGARIVAAGMGAMLLAAWGSSGGGERRGEPKDGTEQDARIDTVPLLTIGDDPGDPLHRVSGAVLVGDTLIIAQSTSLRFYDRHSGEFLQRAGRRGDGPGEYREIASLQRVGERLYTYDFFSRRVTVRDLSGALERTVDIEYWAPYRTPDLVGVFGDGSFLFAAEFRDYDNPARSPMFRRAVMVLGRYDPDGLLVDSLGYYLGPERYVAPNERGGKTRGQPPPFGRRSSAGVIGDEFYILNNKVAMIPVFDAAGTLVREIGPDTPPDPVRISREDLHRFADFDDIDRDDLPQFYPFYSRGSAVVGGTIWIQDYLDRERDQGADWTVYSHEGQQLRRVTTRERLKILTVDGDVAVVVHFGGWDVETVQLRRVVSP